MKTVTTNNELLSYVAGVVDSVGCIGLGLTPRLELVGGLIIPMASKNSLKTISYMIGGGKLERIKGFNAFRLVFTADETVDVMLMLQPHLKFQSKQASLFLRAMYDVSDVKARMLFVEAMGRLNNA